MATKIRRKTNSKKVIRFKHKSRIRDRVNGTAERPRLCFFRSNSHVYAQIIDDVKATTLAAASTLDEELKGKASCNMDGVKQVGNLIAKRALAKDISKVCFDRSGYLYHGRVKAFADAARESGLKF